MGTELYGVGLGAVWPSGPASPVPCGAADRLDPNRIQLLPLLRRRDFHRPEVRGRNYAWAGSFVGYLIRRFGWARFEQLYRRSHAWNVRVRFERVYGFTRSSYASGRRSR